MSASRPSEENVVEVTETVQPPSRWNIALKEMLGGSVVISILSVVIALIVGAILIALTDPKVHEATTYFVARPLS